MADKNDQNDQKCGNKTEEFNIRKEDNIDIKRIKKKQDTKDALNFTKTIILRATFLLLFCHQPKASKTHPNNSFEILHKISDRIPKLLVFLVSREKRWKIYLLLKACFV